MPNYLLSWTAGVGTQCRGGNQRNCHWNDIKHALDDIKLNSGSVTVDIADGPEIGPQSLQVQSAGKYSVLSLGEDDGEDYFVRSFTNSKNLNQDQVDILGNLWDARIICTDFEIVICAFQEFFATGNVSQKLLS